MSDYILQRSENWRNLESIGMIVRPPELNIREIYPDLDRAISTYFKNKSFFELYPFNEGFPDKTHNEDLKKFYLVVPKPGGRHFEYVEAKIVEEWIDDKCDVHWKIVKGTRNHFCQSIDDGAVLAWIEK